MIKSGTRTIDLNKIITTFTEKDTELKNGYIVFVEKYQDSQNKNNSFLLIRDGGRKNEFL